jgi:hypothetical protein
MRECGRDGAGADRARCFGDLVAGALAISSWSSWRERPTHLRHGGVSESSAFDERSLTVAISTVAPTGAAGGIASCALVSR